MLNYANTNNIMPAPEAIENAAKEIFASPEFRNQKDYLAQWIESILNKLFGNTVIKNDAYTFTAFLVMVITISIIGALIIFIIYHLSNKLVRNTHLYDKAPETVKDDRLTFDRTLINAREAAQKEYYSTAIKWLFISVLLILQEQSFITIHPSKTNRQYMKELVGNNSPHTGIFKKLSEQFNSIRYGGREATIDDYNSWLNDINQIKADSSFLRNNQNSR